jgi:hypothetical protein
MLRTRQPINTVVDNLIFARIQARRKKFERKERRRGEKN